MAGLGTDVKLSNRILNALPNAALARLRPHLKPVELPAQRQLSQVGESMQTLYFIEHGMASLVHTMSDGRTVEVGAIGAEGLVGASNLFVGHQAVLDCVMQVPGDGVAITRDTLKREIAHDAELNALLHAYESVTIRQLAQTAACNRLHTLEERCCRWLLTAHDSAGADTFPLTHEFLAMMLGVRRPGVTLAARELQKADLIRYSRGKVTIVDRAGLEKHSCECYAIIRKMIDHLFARRS